MKTIANLLKKLEEKYGKKLSYNSLEVLNGSVNGTIDGKKISISCGDGFLIFSIDQKGDEILAELMPILKNTMGNQDPICCYDLVCENSGVQAMPTIEWNSISPDQRIKDIVNGRAYVGINSVENLVLFNDKEIFRYEESEEEKAAVMASAKISGIYPGNLIKPQSEPTELALYFLIEMIDIMLCDKRYNMKQGLIPFEDLTEEQFSLEYLLYQTTRFGVVMPEPIYGKRVELTPSYIAWYRFYNNHFKAMSKETWNVFSDAYAAGEDVTAYLPRGKWQDLLEDTKLQP